MCSSFDFVSSLDFVYYVWVLFSQGKLFIRAMLEGGNTTHA